MTTVEVLRAARELLVTAGWCQGSYSKNGCYCARGAVNKVTSTWAHVTNAEARGAVRALEGVVSEELISWNDARVRSKDTVLRLFDRAIAAEAATGTGKHVTPEELEELRQLAKDAREAPVMTVRSDLPTFAESAAKRLQDRVNELAAARGLARADWDYGVHGKTGEVLE